jgi:hypothetical protein
LTEEASLLRFLKFALLFEFCAVVFLSVLMGQFFYRAYETSSNEHLPVTFLAALVILVLGTMQTAASFHRERARVASGLPPRLPNSLRLRIGYTSLVALVSLATVVIVVVLRHHHR